MKKYLLIVLFVGVCFGQDVYPYFSDMEKQLEFEQKRIFIKHIEKDLQIISGGGSYYNWLSEISAYQPRSLVKPIRTDYNYIRIFEIILNGKIISEIDFLNIIGFEEKADSLINYYNQIFINNSNPDNFIFNEYRYNRDKQLLKNAIFVSSVVGFITYSMFSSDDNKLIGFALPSSFTAYFYLLYRSIDKKNYFGKDKLPTLKPYLTKEQIKSLSESYNRKLYSKIAKN